MTTFDNPPAESRYIGFERGISKSELDALCKKNFPLEFEKIQKGHLRTSVDLFLEELLPNAIQLIPYGDPKLSDTLFAIGYDITGRSESYVAKEETSLRLKLGNSRVGIERVFGRMGRIDEIEEPAPRAPAPAPIPAAPPPRHHARPHHNDSRSPSGPRSSSSSSSNAPSNSQGAGNGRPPRADGPQGSNRHPGSKPRDPRQDSKPRQDAKPRQFSR